MIKGVDLSSLSAIEECGGKYYLNNIETDCIEIMKLNNINLIRLRLFNNPYDENGKSYGAGNCDLKGVIETAKKVKDKGLDWYLDFHYSDCWADPGKQRMPKKWVGLNIDELEKELYDYTYDVLSKLKELNLNPSIVSIGNEITNGICWPIGHKDNFENLVRLLNAGIEAAKQVMPESKIMLHLDNGGRNDIYQNFFDKYFKLGGLDFDIIGLSYYIFWHGQIQGLIDNLKDLSTRYNKDLMVVEVSYAFTDKDYKEYEKLEDSQRKGMATKPELLQNLPFEVSEDGQAQYMKYIMDIISDTPRCLGFVYWGGEDIPVPGVSWASQEGIDYMKEKGPGGHEWCNQALFDYDGNALKILEVIKEY